MDVIAVEAAAPVAAPGLDDAHGGVGIEGEGFRIVIRGGQLRHVDGGRGRILVQSFRTFLRVQDEETGDIPDGAARSQGPA